jgi:hypothetical protein
MKKLFILAVCFVMLTTTLVCYSQEVVFNTSLECSDLDGSPRWKSAVQIIKKQGNIFTLTEKGEGKYSGYKHKISWDAQVQFEDSTTTVKPLKMEQHIFNEKGKEIKIIKQDYDYDNNVVTIVTNDLVRKKIRTKRIRFKRTIINRLLLSLYLQKLITNNDTNKVIQMLSEDPRLFNVEIIMKGKEEIDINGEKIEAYKIILDPKLGILSFVKIFLPKAYTWHETKPVYGWLMYQGLEGTIKSPVVRIIRVK